MTKPIFFDSVRAAITYLDAHPEVAGVGLCSQSFADAIKGVDFGDAQQTLSFLMPQLLRVEQGTYMLKYPLADYAEFMPIDTQGSIWTAGSLYYSGDIAGKPEWFDVAADDMPYADSSRTQFLQENWMAAIGYKWNRGDLERAQQLGTNVLADKADAASKSAERFIHKTAMRGDGLKFTTGFVNDALATATTASAAITAASDPDQDVQILNAGLNSVLVNTGETYEANTLALPTTTYNIIAGKRLGGTSDTVLSFFREKSTVSNLTIKRSRHLETAGAGSTKRMIAYANTPEVHRFHLPGGGHQLFTSQPFQKGPFSWEVPGLMSIGGYEIRIPKAKTNIDGI